MILVSIVGLQDTCDMLYAELSWREDDSWTAFWSLHPQCLFDPDFCAYCLMLRTLDAYNV